MQLHFQKPIVRDWEDDQAYDYKSHYPGNVYVDVPAADIYKTIINNLITTNCPKRKTDQDNIKSNIASAIFCILL